MSSCLARLLYALILILSLAACSNANLDEDSALLVNTMDLKRKIGSLMMVGVPGKEINQQNRAIIQRYHPGGVILFGYNIGSAAQTRTLIADLQKEAADAGDLPLFISIDQEGGRVVRIVDGITQFPGNMAAGVAAEPDLVYRWARILAMQLRLLGVNMNLAPDLDVNNNPENPVINTRSFGSDASLVASLGVAYIRGLQEAFCIAVGKHFPGHGDTNLDSHRTLPSIVFDLARLRSLELVPFIRAIAAGLEGIMSAHISFPVILQNDEPATISPFMLSTLLRKELGFTGIVLTDDMEMKGITGAMDIGEGAVRAVQAGADIVLVSTHGKSVESIQEALFEAVQKGRITPARIDESVGRIIRLKLKYRIMRMAEGKAVPHGPVYDKKDMSLLKEAPLVNRELSRKSILYQGDPALVPYKVSATVIAVTGNPVMKKALQNSGVRVIPSFSEKAVKAIKKGSVRCLLVYHAETSDVAIVKAAGDACARLGIGFVAAVSGNPFPFTSAGAAKNYLLSFSNTAESIHQLGCCIKGEFMPKTTAKLDLGFPSATIKVK